LTYIGQQPSTTFDSGIQDRFTGLTTNTVTLTHDISSEVDILVVWNNIVQDSSTYSVGGVGNKTLTLGGTLSSGDVVTVYYTNKVMQSVNPTAGSVTTTTINDTAVTGAKLNTDVISAQTALGATPADTDELLVSDAGVLKRVDYSYIKGGNNTPRFYAYRNGTQTLANNSYTVVGFNAESSSDGSGQGYDSDGTFDISSNHRFTPGVSGKYFLHTNVATDSQNEHNYHITIRKNGSAIARGKVGNEHRTSQGLSITIDSDTNDYFDVEVMQDSGGGRNILSGYEYTWFTGFKLA